jgi:flagellar biosynthesis protein FlhA
VFAVFVVFIVLALFIPLTEVAGGVLIDFLLMLNISIALIILLITMYIKEALEFSIFPTILLVTTLFRLALTVSTTRGILLKGYAGEVIKTFGSFVMGGNAGVGFVIFVILVLANFLVITKGAERVSEVAARFTLDAMPGKQMAIDADLAAGSITDEQAKLRRSKIQRESDFFGAMDGATKFVKGDAIMSIISALVNLIVGSIFGMMRGMDFATVLSSYTLATVGDGLSSQIPALMIAVATGMVVTRTASEGSFNDEVRVQFVQNPTVFIITGGVVIVMMLIPGFPKFVLFTLGSALIVFGIYMLRFKNQQAAIMQAQAALEEHRGSAADSVAAGDESASYRDIDNVFKLLTIDQVEMEFGYSLLHLVDEKSGGTFIERLVLFRKDFAMRMGMVFPSVRMRNNPEINPNQYIVKIKGEEVARGEILADHYLALDSGDVTAEIDGIDTIEPAFGIPAKWISEDKKVMADVAGYTLIDPVSVMITHLSEIIKEHSHEILSRQDVKTMVDNVKAQNPTVVEDLVPNVISIGYLQRVLQALLKEGVPIRDMETILETLSENTANLKDLDLTVEYVRQALKRTITHKFAEAGALRVITLDPRIEDHIVSNIRKTDKGSMYIPDPDTAKRIIDKTMEITNSLRDVLPALIVLTSPIARIYFKKLVETYIPGLVALSYNEVDTNTQIQAMGTITID